MVTWGIQELNELPELLQKEGHGPVIILDYTDLDDPDIVYGKYVSQHKDNNEVTLDLIKIWDHEEDDDVLPCLCNVFKGKKITHSIYKVSSFDSIVIETDKENVSDILSEFKEYSDESPLCYVLELGATRHAVSEGVVIESIIGYPKDMRADAFLPVNILRLYLEDKLIGIASVHFAHVPFMALMPTIQYIEIIEPYRGMGYGRVLVDFFEKQSRELGYMLIGVEHIITPGFFEKLGFYDDYSNKRLEDIMKRLY